MSSPPTQLTVSLDWAFIAQQTAANARVIRETQARLSPEDGQKFTQLFLDFTSSNPPSVVVAQTTLGSLFAGDTELFSRYSSFLMHPASTPAECEAARAEFGRILVMPMLNVLRTIPDQATEDLFMAVKDRLGEQALDRFVDAYLKAPRDAVAGRPTRPALVELLQGDEDLVRRLNILWPEERGIYW